jgi:hypothetical protein
MVEMLVSLYLVTTYSPCTPVVRLDARLLVTTFSTMHYICDVIHGGSLICEWIRHVVPRTQ